MTFEDIEVPQFSEQKPIVVDAAVPAAQTSLDSGVATDGREQHPVLA